MLSPAQDGRVVCFGVSLSTLSGAVVECTHGSKSKIPAAQDVLWKQFRWHIPACACTPGLRAGGERAWASGQAASAMGRWYSSVRVMALLSQKYCTLGSAAGRGAARGRRKAICASFKIRGVFQYASCGQRQIFPAQNPWAALNPFPPLWRGGFFIAISI